MTETYDFSKFSSELDIYTNGTKLDLFDKDKEIIIDDKYIHILVRSIFDGKYGQINLNNDLNDKLVCSFMFNAVINKSIFNIIKNFYDIKYDEIGNTYIEYYNYNALDLLSKIYDNSDARCRNLIKYNRYLKWINGSRTTIPYCDFSSVKVDAVIPSKTRASDVGYDLTIIEKVKDFSPKIAMYDTGIIVSPQFGFYTKIVPRSSIIKSGYMLTNSMGIIDGTYRGTLKICLTKIDDTIPDLTLPFKCCQLILEPHYHYSLNEVNLDKISSTSRSTGGFGSTNKL
jgi:deoxyuridine 5'-triphosphate nucleotidohydrolase